MLDRQRNLAWIIKHRPKNLSEMVGDEARQIKSYIENGNLPHLLFVSKTPGSGKTSLAKAIINELDADYLELNSSMDRGIDVIRDKIIHFVSTASTNNQKKIVFFDESDGLTGISQESLRNLMESHAFNVIFILTANNEEKIIEPIKNRCEVFRFNKHKKEEVRNYLIKICDEEELKYSIDGLDKLVDLYSPSIRSMVGQLQKLKNMGVSVEVKNVELVDDYKDFWLKLKEGKVIDCMDMFFKNFLDVEKTLQYLFDKGMYEEGLNIRQRVAICRVIADLMVKIKGVFDKEKVFVGHIYDIHLSLVKNG